MFSHSLNLFHYSSLIYIMEYLFPSILFLLTFLLIIIISLIMKASSKTYHDKASITSNVSLTTKLPPGPMKLPLIGNLHNLISSSLPHHRLRDLAKQYGPLMHLQLGEVPHIVVSSPEIAKEMMKTHDLNFFERPFLLIAGKYYGIDIIFAHYGDYWRQMRKICAEQLLSPRRVQSFRSIREEEVFDLIQYVHSKEGESFNLSEKISTLTYNITARAVFGKKCKEQRAFISAVEEVLKIAAGFSVTEAFPSQKWLHWISRSGPSLEMKIKLMETILDSIVNEHKNDREQENVNHYTKKTKGFLDVLLDLQGSDELTIPLEPLNITAIILDMFIGGSETSSVVVEWTMLELLKNPTSMEKAQAEVRQVFGKNNNVDETKLHELKFLKMVIKEIMRLHPPGPFLIPRESKESCVMNGYYIPAKTKVLVHTWAIGRDPKYWSEAEKFYPERFIDSSIDFKGNNFELIPFGAGRRICPGISFALANIELHLAQLLFHFDWKLPNGITHENLDMTEVFGMTVRRKGDLFVIPIPRNNPLVIG
ncbi:cytochrome P450 71D10 [Cannabis sativa]|uniref:cytochrome P450 71D10 n=1 Tax=Cannabis sativa TaxID=3483 RepID=UPI0029C9E8D5|nr:cytochrome P450 71D10 [Cannabis sativa]